MIFHTITIAVSCLAASLLVSPSPGRSHLAQDEQKETEREVIAVAYADAEGHQVTQHFRLEIAADSIAISRGLSGREEIKEDGGMLFVYPSPGQRSYWMRNCLVDIDIIFLDSAGTVVRTYEMKKEPLRRPGEEVWRYERRLQRYRSIKPAQFAIEIRAGWLKKLAVEEGDVINADWKRIAKHAENDE